MWIEVIQVTQYVRTFKKHLTMSHTAKILESIQQLQNKMGDCQLAKEQEAESRNK